MKVKRKSDGTVFEFEFMSYGRGEWGINLLSVNNENIRVHPGDPDYNTEAEARKAAREMVEYLVYEKPYGWVIMPQSYQVPK